jgi:hypothetical protein
MCIQGSSYEENIKEVMAEAQKSKLVCFISGVTHAVVHM